MFSAIGRAVRGALTAVIARMERRVYRNVVLPPGFVLPSKRDLTPRSADSSSADGMDGRCKSNKSVRFLLPVAQAGGASGDANYVVVTPLDSPRGPRKGKPKRRKKKRKESPATVKSLAFDGKRKLPRSFMPGLLAKVGDSGSDSDASDSSTGRRRRRRREKPRTSVRASTPPSRNGQRPSASKRMRQLKPSRSAPRLVAPPRLWDSSDSESDRGSPGGRRRRRVLPRPRSALSVGGYPSDDEADAVKSLTMVSLKGRKHRRGTGGSGGGSSRRARMYMPSQLT